MLHVRIGSGHGLYHEGWSDVAREGQNQEEDGPQDDPGITEGLGKRKSTHSNDQVENVDKGKLYTQQRNKPYFTKADLLLRVVSADNTKPLLHNLNTPA